MKKKNIIARSSHQSVTPRKANLVLKSIVGLSPQDAINKLKFVTKRASFPIIKLLKQSLGNASDQYKLTPDKLIIDQAYATKGRTLKFVRFGGRGRVKPYQKIASHLTIILKDISPDVKSVKITKNKK